MWASRPGKTSARAPAEAQLGIRVSKHVMVVIRSAHLLLQVASGCGKVTVPGQGWFAQAIRGFESESVMFLERAELAGLQLALDLGVDLVLGRVGIRVAQLPTA